MTDREPRLIQIRMSLPPRELSPNARPHWAAKARAVRRYREMSGVCAMAEMRQQGFTKPFAHAFVLPIFTFPRDARRDLDNLAASLKAGYDGLVDGGVVTDDRYLMPQTPLVYVDRFAPAGFVTLVVKEVTP